MNPGSGFGGAGPQVSNPTHSLLPPLWRPSPYTAPRFPRRATGLPEKYCIEAERKANILPAAPVS